MLTAHPHLVSIPDSGRLGCRRGNYNSIDKYTVILIYIKKKGTPALGTPTHSIDKYTVILI